MADGVAQEEAPKRVGEWQHVEGLLGIEAGEWGGGDVANGVAARFAQRDVAGFQFRPKLRAVLQLHVVDLDVLPGRDVVLAGAVFVTHLQNGAELVEGQEPHGHLDADHLHAGLTLTVNAAGEAEAAEALFVEFAFAEEQDPAVQVEDVALDDGVVNFVDEAEHGRSVECRVSKWVKQKRPPQWEAFVEV